MAIMLAFKKSITTEANSNLFFKRVWVHFWIPQSIIFNWDRQFFITFWLSLWSRLETKITKSIASHPQIDGQTEVVNRMIEHILCIFNYKNPRTWDESLPYIQCIYNKSIHISTDHNLFQVGWGFQPLGTMDVALPLSSTPEESSHA
jgi:hypothetical protein